MLTRILSSTFSMYRVKLNKKPQIPFQNWQIVKGDQVQVRTGSDRGKIGKVLKVHRRANAVVVEGVNMLFKKFHDQQQKQVLRRKASKIHVSNVGLYDPIAKKAVRIKYGYHPQTFEKLRISKKTGTILPKPKYQSSKLKKASQKKIGIKDTTSQLAHKITYKGEDFEKIKKQFQEFITEKERRQRNLVFTF